jgi:hypothetical protein
VLTEALAGVGTADVSRLRVGRLEGAINGNLAAQSVV